jgi:hypothetical protein
MNNKNSRTNALPGLTKKSPINKKYDFNKKTKDYTKSDPNSIGSKIAKAVTPKSMTDLVPIPVVGKAVKGAKAVYNYFKEDKKA